MFRPKKKEETKIEEVEEEEYEDEPAEEEIEDEEEETEEYKKFKKPIKKTQSITKLTADEVIAGVEFNLQRANYLLQLLKP
jgi:hypothetical protein